VAGELIPAIAFIGRHDSGKTTLIVQVIAELTARGRRVASIKHHSHAGFEMDREGKDSWRHAQAGSVFTAVAAPGRVGFVRELEQELTVEQIIAHMSAIAADGAAPVPDLIIVEGYRASQVPSIDVFRAGNPRDEERPLQDATAHNIVAVATSIPRVAAEATAQGLPAFDLGDIAGLCDYIEARIFGRLEA
jgi:molybdopterin-guanine dinucleotide biosynthesis protein MobB